MTARPLAALVADGDPDELVREVDRRAARGDWDGLLELRERCLAAARETGRQLWGPAQFAEYRLALDAPAALAAAVVAPGAATFALGPLTEVVAQHHTWSELAPHLAGAVVAATVAQERVLRGEDLRDDERAAAFHGDPSGGADLEPPLVLQPWEPAYPLPEYRPDELLENGPAVPERWTDHTEVRPGPPADLPALEQALHRLVAPWEEHSTGEVHVAAVAGDAAAAVAAVVTHDVRLAPLALPQAFAWMAWAAASGGAHGRRRGLAAGRAAAWFVAHVATGLAAPADPDELEFELEELRWYAFAGATEGWHLRLVVEDPRAGWAVAVDGVDPPRVVG